ncbi:hypothetical protein BMS3Abin04_00437 [bacterium BMS3Abin04]|nr:hypothetical protein BMS3Abin04_00437 [bacterium BMS3Abin04]
MNKCRFCGSVLELTFVDLGMSPLCESYLNENELNRVEPFYPLHLYVCENCFLVQLQEYVDPEEIFTEYAYFSSYSQSWLEHAKRYSENMVKRFKINQNSFVVEIASNDGYLLQNFIENKIPVLGIEPAANVAKVAMEKNINTMVEFFSEKLAEEIIKNNEKADLIIGNNVLAQVPDLNDFIKGVKTLLAPNGIITFEFPHLMHLVKQRQFDTIYHEHFSYFSFYTIEKIFSYHGLKIFDVEELKTHGGSLRIYGCHIEDSTKLISKNVDRLRNNEIVEGISKVEYYTNFQEEIFALKREILDFFIKAKEKNKIICGYGAPGKGNTLLNFCGIRTDFLEFTVDRNPYKQGKFLPGTHIPIYSPEKIAERKPDYIFILPWNLKDEIINQLSFTGKWGAKFIIPIPKIEII